jgi:hypothetical protein
MLKRLLIFVLGFVLSGCGTFLVDQHSLCGVYTPEGIVFIAQRALDLKPDGSYVMQDTLYRDTDVISSGPSNVVFGHWTYARGTMVLAPEKESIGWPSAPIGLERKEFRVRRSGRHIRLISGEGKNQWSLRK